MSKYIILSVVIVVIVIIVVISHIDLSIYLRENTIEKGVAVTEVADVSNIDPSKIESPLLRHVKTSKRDGKVVQYLHVSILHMIVQS